MSTHKFSSIITITQLLIALAATLGSLYFSEILRFPPCDLCWYQRIFIYPIPIIVLTGLYIQFKDIQVWIDPFIVLGLGVSIYHNLIYYKIIEVIVPCSENAPCTTQYINLFGFITIPLLSLIAFGSLGILSLLAHSTQKGN